MNKTLNRLQRVLDLEASQGYKNKAVVGGIRQFATFWVGQAREAAVTEMDKVLVEQVAEVLADYGRLPGTEARAKIIEQLQAKLQQRQAQEPDAVPKQVVSQPPQPKPEKRPEPQAVTSTPPPRARVEAPPPSSPVETQPAPAKSKKPGKWDRRAARQTVESDPAGLAQPVTAVHGIGPKLA